MSYRGQVQTIQDLEDLFYGLQGSGYIQKTDAPVISTTTGVYNALYGAKCWVQLNLAANLWGVLAKKPWLRSGWRVITARASATVIGGVAEDGVIPDTIKPTFAELSTKPKTVAHTFHTSEVMQFLGTVDDSLEDVMATLREYIAKEHAEHINKMLNTQNGTLAGNNIESIDRVLGSYSEVSTLTDSANAAYTAGDVDLYGSDVIDRDTGTGYADAYVNGATADRPLTLTLIDTVFQNVWTNGGNPQVITTGYDTLMKIQQLLQANQRFVDTKKVSPSVNGIVGVDGIEAGFIVATYNGVPIIPDKNTVQDTSALSRMNFLDTNYVWMEVAKPTQYFETGIISGDPWAINSLGQEGMYRTLGEIKCMFFGAQGKLRDVT